MKRNLEAQYIVDMLEKYQSEDYESEKKKAFMLTTYNCFKKYLI